MTFVSTTFLCFQNSFSFLGLLLTFFLLLHISMDMFSVEGLLHNDTDHVQQILWNAGD